MLSIRYAAVVCDKQLPSAERALVPVMQIQKEAESLMQVWLRVQKVM